MDIAKCSYFLAQYSKQNISYIKIICKKLPKNIKKCFIYNTNILDKQTKNKYKIIVMVSDKSILILCANKNVHILLVSNCF